MGIMSLYTVTFDSNSDSDEYEEEEEIKKVPHPPKRNFGTPSRPIPRFTPVKITKRDLSEEPSPSLNYSYDDNTEKHKNSPPKSPKTPPNYRRPIMRTTITKTIIKNDPNIEFSPVNHSNKSQSINNETEINDSHNTTNFSPQNQNETKKQNENEAINQNETKIQNEEETKNEDENETKIQNEDENSGQLNNQNEINTQSVQNELPIQQNDSNLNNEPTQIENSTVSDQQNQNETTSPDLEHQISIEKGISSNSQSFHYIISRQNKIKLFGVHSKSRKFDFSLNNGPDNQHLYAIFDKNNPNVMNILKGPDYDKFSDQYITNDSSEIGAMLFSPGCDSFSLRRINQYGDELMSMRIYNSKNDGSPQSSYNKKKGFYKVHFFFDEKYSLSGFNYATFEASQFVQSSKNVILKNQAEDVLVIKKIDKNAIDVTFTSIPAICAFVIGIATYMYTK